MLGLAFGLFSIVAWSSNYLAGRQLGLLGVDPIAVSLARFAIATPLLFLFAGGIRYRGGLLDLLVAGLLGVTVFNLSLYASLLYITAPTASLFVVLSAPITYAVAVLLGRDVPNATRTGGLALSVLGAYLMLGPYLGGKDALGPLLALVSTVSWSLYTVYVTKLYARYDPLNAMAWTALMGTLAMAPTLPVLDVGSLANINVIPLLLYIAVVPGAAAFAAWNYAVSRIGPSKAAALLPLMPPTTAAMSYLALGEGLTWSDLVAASVTLVGVYLTLRR